MASPYSSQSASNYNASAPADDGSQVSSNRITWAGVKSKLADPLKAFADNLNAAIVSAFGKTFGSAGVGTTAISYAVQASDQGKLIRATNSGITITTPDATSVQSPFSFAVRNGSSGSITVAAFTGQTIDDASTISLASGGGVVVHTDGANWDTCGQVVGTPSQPQGRLTLTSGTPILSSDVTAATSVYYTPHTGNLVPIYNGTLVQMRQFSELTLALQANSNFAANAIYDVFIFDSSGTITIGIGPAWSTATAGSGARGTGAGTTELLRINGLWTNKVQITARNGGSTYTVAANQATYVGSISIDGTNGQVSCHLTYGQSRKYGVWNACNRVPIVLKAGDSTSSWSYASATIRASNGTSANSASSFVGLPEEVIDTTFMQKVDSQVGSGSLGTSTYIGLNSTSSNTGFGNTLLIDTGDATKTRQSTGPARYVKTDSRIGIDTFNCLESGSTNNPVFFGTEANMLLTVSYRG